MIPAAPPTPGTPASTPPARPRRWLAAAATLGLWTLLGVLASAQMYFTLLAEGQPVRLWMAASAQLPFWYLWAMLTPLVVWLGRRYPVKRQGWPARAALHIACAASLALAHALALTAARRALGLATMNTFGEMYVRFATAYFHINLLAYGAILGVSHALDYARRLHEREVTASQLAAQLAQAQLRALRTQLNPHFLFNALHTVAMLVRGRQNAEAVKMLAGMSELLRHVLDDAGAQEVPLRQELALLDRYLAIERVRFHDRLRVQLDIAPDVLDLRVPNLVLQPLVENAIRHGISRRAAAGLLEISARQDDGKLWLEVRDDGPGLAAAAAYEALDRGAGVGLANTRARLERLYGGEGRFDVRDAPGTGVVATIVIPARAADAGQAAAR
ncbi:MAG: histidine kinase [Gemmatimonadaceae bacterium]